MDPSVEMPTRTVSLEGRGIRVDVFQLEDCDYSVVATIYADGRIDAGVRWGEDTIEFHTEAGLEIVDTTPGDWALAEARTRFVDAHEGTRLAREANAAKFGMR